MSDGELAEAGGIETGADADDRGRHFRKSAHLERLGDGVAPGAFEEPTASGGLGQFYESLGSHDFAGERLEKADHLDRAIATRQRDLATGEAMGKRVRGIMMMIVVMGIATWNEVPFGR